ncbi:MAG: SMP-30/gluconolactonase/LRE family protein [Actinomycetota bacterium]
MASRELTTILDDLAFGEGPRWHDGRLWFSDFYRHEVVAVTPDGEREHQVEVPNQPSGLGWTPDGDLLVVSMLDRRLLRWDGETLAEHADLSSLVTAPCNDMVVDGDGRAYVGNFGFEYEKGETFVETLLVIVEPDGTVAAGPDDLAFPNGTVITPDGATLVVGESWGRRLTAFERDPATGALGERRVWADLAPGVPDGICLDADGAIWVGDPRNGEVFRVLEGGEVTDRISCGDGRHAFACMLGGDDGTTLFVVTNVGSGSARAGEREGRIEKVEVDVPAAGWP